MKVIAITGTPGTGKTTFAKKLAKQLGFEYVDVNALIEKQKLHEGMDKQRDTKIVDTDKLNTVLGDSFERAKKKKGIIIDSHLSHYLPAKKVAMCIVCKCELLQLKKRLVAKGFSQTKVAENMDAEIFDVCYNEAKEGGHKPVTYDSTKK
ncbi:MAG: AAA family ATPase [Candidatus Woesearchaeota archaeon]|jgi:adenylate kinase|nr:AAA family ATPase [Candidatus Woesearchaeota archaeon]